MLTTLGTGQGYLKAGFLGFPKSGKTRTAVELATGLWMFMGKAGRLVMFDTEGGSEYVASLIKKRIGLDLIGVRARAFSDLMTVTKELHEGEIFIVDSITHPWRELCDSHLDQINRQRAAKNQSRRNKLEFQDWNVLKLKWAEWTDFYLNSKVHIIIAGRAGYEYDMETNEETGRKELIKTGIKMKTEGEFGFEPSLLVEMERVQTLGEKTEMSHRATVLGDRFGVLDGKQCENPTFSFFLPHIKLLRPGAHAPIDTELKTDTGVDESGDGEWSRERRERTILAEEIQGLLVAHYPGQTAEEKRTKADLLYAFFGTRSWTAVENMKADNLRDGLTRMRDNLEPRSADAEKFQATDDDLPEILKGGVK